MPLEPLLLAGAVFAVLLWATMSLYVLYVTRRRISARTHLSRVLQPLTAESFQSGRIVPVNELTPQLDALSRDMLLHVAADAHTPLHVFQVLCAYIEERWVPERLLQEATAHARSRDLWRRIAALRILFRAKHPSAIALLERALEEADADVASAALSMLGTSTDPAAVDIMIRGLQAGRLPSARIAIHLESSPQRPIEALRRLLHDPEPRVRACAANLVGDYPHVEGLEAELAGLVHDIDPGVRKATIASLGRVSDEAAAEAALTLLEDPVAFVRAQAARTLGDLERDDCAAAVARLLEDKDWWVRAAAKQSLETMGSGVWTVLVRCLDHHDQFVRNAAAEIFQNLGILDSLIVMEAASDDPSPSKVDLLRRIAHAGGARLTESLVERAGVTTGPKVRRLLANIGLEHVGAA